MTEKLPSIDDFYEELPSVDEIIIEEKLPSVDQVIVEGKLPSVDEVIIEEKLPSVDEYIEPPRPEEEIADAIRKSEEEEEIIDTAPCSIEEQYDGVIKLIDEVRQDIPEIPEIKYYDEQLEELTAYVEEVKENIPTYDNEISAICDVIDELKETVRTNAANIPEIRYYDDEIESLESSLKSLPEIRHYEGDITSIRDEIVEIKETISNAPNYEDEINSLEYKFDQEIQKFSEEVEVKNFDKKIEIDNLERMFKADNEKIYEELKKSSDLINEYRLHLKDDDRKLKKQILGQYNLLKENIEKKVKEFNSKNIESQNIITGSLKEYFNELQEKISSIPEIKYYDEEIKDLNVKFDIDIKELRDIVNQLKESQKEHLQENLLTEPPETDNEDPLTPLDQKFVTYEKLRDNYQLFVNRVQQQLASFGGGGASRATDLEDVDFNTATGDNKILVFNADGNGTKFVGIASTSLINVVTGNLEVTGNISCAGTVTYDDVTFVDSIGVVTARTGIELGAGSITPVISFEAATETTTTTSASTIDTFAAATYRSAQYQIQITQGSNYHVTTLNVLHDGSQVYIMEFGTIRTGVALATFDADISSGNVRVRGTPTTSLSTVFKLSKVLTRV